MSESPPLPVAVPEFEALRFAGDPITVSHPPSAQFPRLGRTGADECVLVYAGRAPTDTLFSRRIRGAFSKWPPEVGEPVEHQRGEFRNSMDELSAWEDGTFAIRSGAGWVFASVDQPGARYAYRGQAYPEPGTSGGVFTIVREHGQARVVHRSKRSDEAHVVDCGLVAPSMGVAGVVTERGQLLLAGIEHLHQGGTLNLVVASHDGIRNGASVEAPPRARVSALPRSGGGAYLVVSQHGFAHVYRVDEEGQLEGERWTYFNVSHGDNRIAFAPWRQGFALASSRGGTGLGVVVSDGVRATYGEGTIQGPMIATVQQGGLVASPDGRVILFAYVKGRDIEIARLVCASGDGSAPYVPERARAGQERVRAPVQPVYVPSRFGTRDEIVRRIRQRRILAAFGLVRGHQFEGDSAGDGASGRYFSSNGQGDFFVVFWDVSGVVALGFDHYSSESEWSTELDQRDPGKHLPNPPSALEPLVKRASEFGERLATQGFWVAAGDTPAHGASSTLDVLDQLRDFELEDVWIGGGDVVGELAAHMTSSEPYSITPEEGARLLSFGAVAGSVLDLANVERAVKELANLGVRWEDGIEQARALVAAEQCTRDARLSAADRALLHAAHAGDLDGVKKALEEGANIDCPMPSEELPHTPERATPLIVSMRLGHGGVADLLIEAGADLNASCSAWGGAITPLRLAAEQGDILLCRRLLKLGASAQPETANWGLLQQLTYSGRNSGNRGTLSDYAEVIRILLDAGAPLPNDAHCGKLTKMAEAGGAADLVPRLCRVYAEDVLPEVPPQVDTLASAAKVSELIEQAAALLRRDTNATLGLLVEAWRLSLHPRIGEAAETLARQTRGSSLTYIVRAVRGAIDCEASLRNLHGAREAPPDPRAARAILEWLCSHDLSSSPKSIAQCEDAAAALLVYVRDVRFIESLEQHISLRRPNASLPIRSSLRVALGVMKEVVPGTLGEGDIERLGAIEDSLASRKATSQRPTTRDLYAAVYEAPDDDAPRRALADRLVEAGDPRGELVQLQLARHGTTSKVTKREKELIAAHGRLWLGPLDRIVSSDIVFERGFLCQASTGGGTDNREPRVYRNLSGDGAHLEWSTVRRLSLGRHVSQGAYGLLRGSRIGKLRELMEVGPRDLGDLLDGAPRPLERLDLAMVRGPGWWAKIVGERLDEIPEKLPLLASLSVPAMGDSFEWVRRLAERLPHLRELSVGSRRPCLDELVTLAKQRGLAKVRSLCSVDFGSVDFGFATDTAVLDISFPDRFSDELVDAIVTSLSGARDIGVQRVVVRTPPRTKVEDSAVGAARVFKRRSESLDLGRIIEAAERMGVPCDIGDPEDDVSQ